MLIVLSPAKTLDFDTQPIYSSYTQPEFLAEAEILVNELRKFSVGQIAKFMGISPQLADLNFERFQVWHPDFTPENAKQAILAFKGDVYEGMDVVSFSEKDFANAQNYIRILSGLYGVLKPLDLIQPYRLEMGKKLLNPKGKDLYQFWGDQLTDSINKTMKEQGTQHLINLASNEYFKSVNVKKVDADIITPVFMDQKNGQYKVISFYAKKARGLMSRFIVQNELKKTEELKAFDLGGYVFNPNLSKEKELVFTRDH